MSARSQAFYRDAYVELERGRGFEPESEPTFGRRVGRAIAALEGGRKRVLDLGCGDGSAAKRFLAAGHEVVGADVSESAVRIARLSVPRARFVLLEDEGKLPFPDAGFDACFCSEVLEHVLDVEALLREVSRVVAPGGKLLVTVPYHGWLKNLWIVTFGFERHFDPCSGHIRFFSRSSLEACLRRAGFRPVERQGIGRRWPVYKSLFVAAEKAGA